MTAGFVSSVFADPKFYLGLLTIVMFAKDKFNMPTYDRDAIGPFAQLSPQLLTVDSRYRKGRMIYLLSMVFLYTALCIVGPTTLLSLDLPLPFTAKTADAFPAAAAAFLVSTAAANDSSWLGRIELFIRQYAHKAAYIPSAVSDLAFGLRSFHIDKWLLEDNTIDHSELSERQDAIKELARDAAYAAIHQNAKQEGEVAAWIRANILFYTLQQIFNKRKLLTSSRLDYLIDVAENRENFARIQAERAVLAGKLPATGDDGVALEQIYPEVQRFLRTTSLTLAVLMSQAARSSTFLNVHLEELGFRGSYLRDRSDHFVYMTLVYAFICLGALVTLVGLGVTTLILCEQHERGAVYFPLLVSAGTGILSYAVLFGVLDYLRDRLLDSLDWHENLEGYLRVVLPCSIIGSLGCTVLIILAFTLFGLQGLLGGSVAIIQLLIFQLIVVALGAAFGVRYARDAARLPFSRLSFLSPAVFVSPIIHGVCAAILIGGLNFAVNQFNLDREIQVNIDAVVARVGQLRQSQKETSAIKTGWFSKKEPQHINQLLESVDSAITLVNGYIARNTPLDIARREQTKAITVACTELYRFVIRNDNKELFSDPKRCELAVDVAPLDDGDKIFIELVNRMSRLFNALERPTSLDRNDLIALIYSSIGAFFFAAVFGIGFTYWRAWWLHHEREREDGQIARLREQVQLSFGSDVEFEHWLTMPVASVNGITPLEAVRYEDYRGKLFSDVQKKSSEIARQLHARRSCDAMEAPPSPAGVQEAAL